MSAAEDLDGWGRWPRRRCRVARPAAPDLAAQALDRPTAIARGLGRGYGDCAMNPELTVSTARLNRFLAFDTEAAEMTAEAGVSLAEIIATFLPRGFFPAVTPGSKFVTLGGAIAADVHGKNHHREGAFGEHVAWLDLLGGDGRIRRCSAQENPALFRATLGGMGLTGVVLRAAIRLKRVESAWIAQRTIVAPDLDAAIAAFETNLDATYSVAWIDCLAAGASRGRSLVYLGEHATRAQLPADRVADPFAIRSRPALTAPMDAPSWALNRWSVRAFNHVYFAAGRRAPNKVLVDWDRYFYPLDALRRWNRIYGARGFAQYQCALPLAVARDALVEQLDAIAAAGLGSFLAVLKRFGVGAPDRPLSFPIEGYTLALDFPLTGAALTLMDRLDDITLAAGGRLYLAKDSRMTQGMFEAGYPAAGAALAAAMAEGAGGARFASLLSRRLGL